jgi:hypothetical protein
MKNKGHMEKSKKSKILPRFFKMFHPKWGADPNEQKAQTIIGNQLQMLEKHRRRQWRKRVYALGLHKKGTKKFGSTFADDHYPLKYWK